MIRSLTRASKREQMSKKQLKALEEKERIEDYKDDNNPALEERKKFLKNENQEEIVLQKLVKHLPLKRKKTLRTDVLK
ncbi:hypothetical protein [Flavobacterium piscinae]|uniref:hypothetical protein n=1 Tax=Flavobacterium piscinae TaxID=2506424 RepID=UPI002AAAAC00|nr:hypothetical protein [Flavobacterium piscinae]